MNNKTQQLVHRLSTVAALILATYCGVIA